MLKRIIKCVVLLRATNKTDCGLHLRHLLRVRLNMPLEKRGRGGTRGARTNSGVIVGGSMEDVCPPSYAQVMRNNRTNTGSNRNDWTNVGFLSGGTLMTDSLVTQSSVIVPCK